MPADSDVADYLATNGHGTVGEDLFYARFPPKPDDIVCVFQTPGRPPMPWITLESPGLTIIVRAADPDDARTKADAIFKLLAGLSHETINGHLYHNFEATGSPGHVMEPQTFRTMFTFSFIVLKEME